MQKGRASVVEGVERWTRGRRDHRGEENSGRRRLEKSGIWQWKQRRWNKVSGVVQRERRDGSALRDDCS